MIYGIIKAEVSFIRQGEGEVAKLITIAETWIIASKAICDTLIRHSVLHYYCIFPRSRYIAKEGSIKSSFLHNVFQKVYL